MRTLHVELGAVRYPIHVGVGLIDEARALLEPHIAGRQVMLVSNSTVAPLYAARLAGALDGYELRQVVLPDGEAHKTLATLSLVLDALVEARFSRDATIVALGGGVLGDIAGFAAASYQRGIACIQVPTTLLAQVDSSVGGKTGVNHPGGKNLIGAFHQPAAVVIDLATLDTLPDRELSAGLAEVAKYGLVDDLDFLEWIERNANSLIARDRDALEYAIVTSCKAKARIVAGDEKEHGQRALLNLGHTFGHAIEAGLGFGSWLHGEAVAAGTVMAADLSARLGWLSRADVARVERLMQQLRLPSKGPAELAPEQLRELMQLDKKSRSGRLRLVLLEALGRGKLVDHSDEAALGQTLAAVR